MQNNPTNTEISITENDKSVGTFIHLSTFLKYFIPLGNILGPVILWAVNKDRKFVDHHGKEAINFQLSIFIYTIGICFLCLPFFAIFVTDFVSLIEAIGHQVNHIHFSDIDNLLGFSLFAIVVLLLFFSLFILELYAVINAAMHAKKGEEYHYPLCIKFFKHSLKDN